MSEITEEQEQKVNTIVDVIVETVLGIEFKKVFHINNRVQFFVNGIEVPGFNISFTDKHKKEVMIAITANT